MEPKRNDCKQLIGINKLKCQTDTKKNLGNSSSNNRNQDNIKSKIVDRYKCKKCQEKSTNKNIHDDLSIEKEDRKPIQQPHKRKERKICNTIKPSEATKFKETLRKDGSKMETGRKKEGYMAVLSETNDLYRKKYIKNNTTNQTQKHCEVTVSERSDSNITTSSDIALTKQKNIFRTVNNNCKKNNLNSNVFVKEDQIQNLKTANKLGEPAAVPPEAEYSTFSTSTKDSIKDRHGYTEEMNILKHQTQMAYAIINVTAAEENINNINNIYESRRKLKSENAEGPVGDKENHKSHLQEKEDILKHKNVKEKEYFLAGKYQQTEDLISKMTNKNEIQRANLSFKKIKKKSLFSNTFKDFRKEETENKRLKNTGIKPSDDTTLSCDIYENSIGENTPRSKKSVSDSCIKLKRKMYKYKYQKNKILSRKNSTRTISNNKQSKSLQNVKQNNISNESSELNQRNEKMKNEFEKVENELEKVINNFELQKFNTYNIYPNYDSDILSISEIVSKISNKKESVVKEDQCCFADPELYSCDSELIFDDGQKTDNSTASLQKLKTSGKSNEPWNNGRISKSSFSGFEINSTVSLEDLNEKISKANNILEHSNGEDTEPAIHINTIQNEYGKTKLKPNRKEYFNKDAIIHTNTEGMENDMNKLSIQALPHQSAVTLISGFGSKCSSDNREISEGDMDQRNSSLKNVDISLTSTKDAVISASTSYEILRKTKFLKDKGIMCCEKVPLRVKKQRVEKQKKIQQYDHGGKKQNKIHTHHPSVIAVPDILNQGDSGEIEKNIYHYKKYKGIYSDKRQLGRNTKHHTSFSKDISQNKEEDKTDTYIKQEELEDFKFKFKDGFTKNTFTTENVKPQQSKGFWNTLREGSLRIIRFLQDSASFKYCFKKNMFK